MARDNLVANLDKDVYVKSTDSGLDVSFVSTSNLVSNNASDAINEIQNGIAGAVITQPISIVRNTDNSTDLNTVNFSQIPVFGNVGRIESPFTIVGNSFSVGSYTGPIIVNANIHISSQSLRTNLQVGVSVNGIVISAKSSSGYIRASSGHNESSLHLMDIINVSSGDIVSVVSRKEGANGIVVMKENGSSNFIVRVPLQNAAKGEDGIDGYSGFDYLFFNGIPGPGDGQDGDLGQNQLTGALYKKVLGIWQFKANIVGPPGPTGQDGYSGFDYTFSNDIPLNVDGQDGDINTDTSTGNLYKKEAGVWIIKYNINGPTGSPGPSGFSYIVAGNEKDLKDDDFEWSFGGEVKDKKEYSMVLMKDTRIIGISLGLEQASDDGSVNVEARIDGVSIGSITLAENQKSGSNTFPVPVDVLVGSKLSFRTAVEGDNARYATVAVLITHI